MPRTQRSPEAAAYRRFYNSAAWRDIRAAQLRRQPLCERHLKRNQNVPAKVVHHVEPHKGDWARFIDNGNLESLCAACHNSDAQIEERGGKVVRIGADGWPVEEIE